MVNLPRSISSISIVVAYPLTPLDGQPSRGVVEWRRSNLKVQMSTDHLEPAIVYMFHDIKFILINSYICILYFTNLPPVSTEPVGESSSSRSIALFS